MRKLLWLSLLLIGCGQKDTPTQAEASIENTIELVEEVDVVEIAQEERELIDNNVNVNILPQDLVTQMIAYLESLPKDDVELDISLEEYYPVAMLIGQHIDEWLAIYGEPTAIENWSDIPDPLPPYGVDRDDKQQYAYLDAISWQGTRFGVGVQVNDQQIIEGVILHPNAYPSADVMTFAPHLYTLLTDELRKELVLALVVSGELPLEYSRHIYYNLLHLQYITKDNYLVDRGFFPLSYLASLRPETDWHWASWLVPQAVDTRLAPPTDDWRRKSDVAKWSEDFPASPYRAQVGDTLLTLLQREGEELEIFLATFSFKRDDFSLQAGLEFPDDSVWQWEGLAIAPYMRMFGRIFEAVPAISLMAYAPEHRLALWQQSVSYSFSDKEYIVRRQWQGQTIAVTYYVRGDTIESRSFTFVDEE